MNTCIISGGNINHDFALGFIKRIRPDTIIAVDRGMVFTHKNHLPVTCIVGDFDSVPKDILAAYKRQDDIQICAYDPVKDATDTQIAMEKAVEMGSETIWILGATGTRLDHCLGNINCLSIALEAGIPAVILDEYNHISLLKAETVIEKSDQFGRYVSFLPFGETVTGLHLKGFKYPLTDYTLKNTNSLGVSNEIRDTKARVAFTTGILIMIQSRD